MSHNHAPIRDNPAIQDAYQHFAWDDVRRQLGWTDSGPVQLFESIVGRHAGRDKAALVVIEPDGTTVRYSYAQLAQDARKFAHALKQLGIQQGDRVAGLMPRGYPVVVTILATLQLGAIYVPIFTGFRADAIQYRLERSEAKLLVTDASVREYVPAYFSTTMQANMSANIPARPSLKIVTVNPSVDACQGDLSFWDLLLAQTPLVESVSTSREDVAVIIFTSGSTGQPKGGAVAVNFLASVWPYLRYGANLRESDVFWPTGDPGWGYGFICYLGALALGSTIVSATFNPSSDQCIQIMDAHQVTNLATTPTLLRSLMAAGRESLARPPCLRSISSCGEPLNGEVVDFFQKQWGLTPMDHFGATELSLPVGNFNAVPMTVFPGSMGLPFPGFEMAILSEDGSAVELGETGLLAKKWSKDALYWLHYWNDPETTAEVRRGDWIVTGDLAYQDENGYFWFKGRQGDMIKSAGYRIGPFEVESALLKHPAVAEAAVVGKGDAIKGQILKAFVVLRPGYSGSGELVQALQSVVKETLGRHLYPKEIEFVERMPKTETGKIQRFILRESASSSKNP